MIRNLQNTAVDSDNQITGLNETFFSKEQINLNMLLIFTHFCHCSKVVTVNEEPFTRETLKRCNKNDLVVLFHCVLVVIYM